MISIFNPKNMIIMKQRKFNWMYLLLIAVFVLSSCAKSSKNARLIPADAAVVSIDVKQMFEKSKLGDNEEAKKKLLEQIESNAKTQEVKDLCKKIVEDPAKAGIDLREPLYFFATKSGDQAVVGTILDKGDFTEIANAIAKEADIEAVKEKDGVQYLNDKDDVIAFDDDAFIISEGLKLDDIIAKFKSDDTKGTMVENEEFAALLDGKGYLKALVPMTILEDAVDAKAKKALPEGAELKDLSMLINVTSDKGVANINIESLAKSDAWKEYIKTSTDICGKINGDYLKYIQKGAFAFFANFDGKKLFEMLDKKEVFKDLGVESQKELTKKVLESIDGDFAISVGEFKGELPNISAYIKTKDQSITDFAKENGMKPEKGMDFGFKDGATYVAIGENGAFTEAKETYQNVKGHRVYIACDIDMMSSLANMVNSSAAQNVKMIGEHVSSAELYDTSDMSVELVLNMKDKEKDPLEYFMQMFLKQIM